MNTIETKFKMGDVLKDKVTGFTGAVLCISRYSTGCTHYSLQSQKVGKDGKISEWENFDENRLVKTRNKTVTFGDSEEKKIGGPAPAISRHMSRK